MENYKTLKAAGKASVSKDGDILQTVKKSYDVDTGSESSVANSITLDAVSVLIETCKTNVSREESRLVELEQLETDLKAL
jgi:hypothetical protein